MNLSRAVGDVQNPAEGRVAESRVGIGAPRPVKGIDQIATELQEHAFAERKSFEEPEILGGLPWAGQVTEISRRIAQCQHHTVGRGGRLGEGRGVQVRLPRASRIIERSRRYRQRHAGNHIAANVSIEQVAAGIDTGVYRERVARLVGLDSRRSPGTENLVHNTAPVEELPASPERQLINLGHLELLRVVEAGY